jgi:S-DNA-T family DNA segregation ATPase FtsK/SpoIIIE
MMDKQYRTEVETTLKILGNEARAAGITLVFATQRPSQDSFPVPLRANLTNRLILKVVDQRNSELVLGRSSAGRAGAESLLGKGHLLAKLDGEKEEIFAQVPFINRSDTANLVNLIANAWKTT